MKPRLLDAFSGAGGCAHDSPARGQHYRSRSEVLAGLRSFLDGLDATDSER